MVRNGKQVIVRCGRATLAFAAAVFALAAMAAEPPREWAGKDLAMDRQKGNCLSCHDMPGVPGIDLPGNIGPALVNIGQRYDRERLRVQIWDAAKLNPETAMPPFGRNKILTEQEIDKVTDFILNL